jgi:cytoplasmic iron level regulating protein YaaA (DUF328/UPF0246 family)
MLVVISPAKRLDWAKRSVPVTEPAFAEDAVRLAKTARNLALRDLKSLMDLSDDLARLNRDRFRAFSDAPETDAVRPALYAFAGDTYQGFDAESLAPDALDWAQDHLRILSGLYGLLRPRDAIQPYRLEMGSKLKTRRGDDLYGFWRDRIAKALNEQAKAMGTDTLVNCASQEYFGAVPAKALTLQVITPQFLEDRGGVPKTISFFAKRARGAMARFIVENRITEVDALHRFDTGGYRYSAELSAPQKPAFIRSEAAAA